MPVCDDLIPRPGVVRDQLARTLRETQLLRRLLRVAEDAAEERHRLASAAPPEVQAAPRPGAIGREEARS
jgi:hypothetical protein